MLGESTLQSMVNSNYKYLLISIRNQKLELHQGARCITTYPVSTAVNGPGELNGSGCTPRGALKVRIKIGAELPLNSVFIGRRPTGEIYTKDLQASHPERDWILSRILWLTGTELGVNRGGEQDTLSRYIYIHGTPDTEPMGVPRSHGCIRMRNSDIIELFDLVKNGTEVQIIDG